jgi:hypothetical protein
MFKQEQKPAESQPQMNAVYQQSELEAEKMADELQMSGKMFDPSMKEEKMFDGRPHQQFVAEKGGLPQQVKNKLEAKSGQNLDDVKLHTGVEADELNEKHQSNALTYGNNIYIKSSELRPETGKGQNLLYHEGWHTVQQKTSGKKQVQLQKTGTALAKGAQKAATDVAAAAFVKPYVESGAVFTLGKLLVGKRNDPEFLLTCFDAVPLTQRMNTFLSFMISIGDEALGELDNSILHRISLLFYYGKPALSPEAEKIYQAQKDRFWGVYLGGYKSRENKKLLQLNDPAAIMKEGNSDFSDILTLQPQNEKFVTGKGNISKSNRKYLLGPAILFYRLARASWSEKDFQSGILKTALGDIKKDKEGTSTDDFYAETIKKIQVKSSWPIESALINVAQGALEGGWGNETGLEGSIKKNNYFGHLLGDGATKKTYKNFEYANLFHYALLNQRWPDGLKLFEGGNITADLLDKTLNSGKHKVKGQYQYNAHEEQYGDKIINEQIVAVLSRWRVVLQEEIECANSFVATQPELKDRIMILQGVLNEINTIKK